MVVSAELGEIYLMANDLQAKREFSDLIGNLGAALEAIQLSAKNDG